MRTETKFRDAMTTNQDMHFVGHKQPFVCLSQADNKPFVCSNKPFVEIPRNSAAGFTLIEALVVVIIAGILTAGAVSSFGNFIQSTRLTSATNDLVGDLSLARTEALKRQSGQVVVCVSSNGSTCDTSTTSWTNGWIVFWDANSSGNYETGDVMLKVHASLPTGHTITSTPANTGSVAFSKLGTLVSATATGLQITNTKINQSRFVCMTIMGRASAAPTTATSC